MLQLCDYVATVCGCVLEAVEIHPGVSPVNAHCLCSVAIMYVP